MCETVFFFIEKGRPEMFIERIQEFLERFIELLAKNASYDDWWM